VAETVSLCEVPRLTPPWLFFKSCFPNPPKNKHYVLVGPFIAGLFCPRLNVTFPFSQRIHTFWSPSGVLNHIHQPPSHTRFLFPRTPCKTFFPLLPFWGERVFLCTSFFPFFNVEFLLLRPFLIFSILLYFFPCLRFEGLFLTRAGVLLDQCASIGAAVEPEISR